MNKRCNIGGKKESSSAADGFVVLEKKVAVLWWLQALTKMLQSAAICLYLDGWQCGQVRIPKGAGGWREASHSVGIFRKPLPILRGLRFSVFVQLKLFGTVRCHKKKPKTQRFNSKNSNVEIILLKSGKIIRKKKERDNFSIFWVKKSKKGKNMKKKSGQKCSN